MSRVDLLLEVTHEAFDLIASKVVHIGRRIFDTGHMLDESLLVVSLGDHVHQDVVLLPHPVDLVVLVLNHGAFTVPGDALLDEALLRDVLGVGVREGRSQIV